MPKKKPTRRKKEDHLNLGYLRKLIEGLPNSTRIRPEWAPGKIPRDHEPGVAFEDMDIETTVSKKAFASRTKTFLRIRVKLFYFENE